MKESHSPNVTCDADGGGDGRFDYTEHACISLVDGIRKSISMQYKKDPLLSTFKYSL